MTERKYFEAAKTAIRNLGLKTDDVADYMDELRDSGEVNMYGASTNLSRKFGFSSEESKAIVLDYLPHGLREVPNVVPDDTTDDVQDPDEIPITVDRAELATILAALRTYQEAGYGTPVLRPARIHDIASGDDWNSLDDAGIDDLCERINCS